VRSPQDCKRAESQKCRDADAAEDCRRQRMGPDGGLEVPARREENVLKDVRESNTDIGAAPVERSSRASQGWGLGRTRYQRVST
jgi:hypothetical protein